MRREDAVRYGVVALKLGTGTAELFAALILSIVPAGSLRSLFEFLAREEVREDPHDPVVAFIRTHLVGFLDARKGVALGLLVLGAVKIVGAVGLLKRRPWGYYLLVVALSLFLAVEVAHLVQRFSVASGVVTVINASVLTVMLIFRRTLLSRHDLANDGRKVEPRSP